RRTPENIAVVYEGKAYSYQQLDELTDRLAKHLITIGVKTEDTVAVLIDRSEYMTIYPLAILKAGAGYMPLDYTFPIDRLEYMLEDAQVKVLLSEGNMPETYLPSFEGIVLKKEDCLTLKDNTDYELPVVKGENKFVILYTSGSTGMPKGCVLEHRNLSNFCKWYQASYQVTEQDKGAAYANFAFDAHMMDLYPFLISGATIHIIPSHMRLDFLEINNYFEKNGISLAFMTTLLGKQFVETFDNKSLRALTVGGEKLPAIKIPKYPLYNAYGPTEGTIISSTHKLNHENECLNIGKPLYNCHSYILDANMQLLPIGAVGELCIGGAGVGRGYLNRPDLTAEKFVMWKGEKIYRTGDFVKWLENGEIEFVGRIDGQVKLRGLRIELGEIESKMNNYEGIKDCAVAVKEIGGTQYLCAYY
ncbi:MAG: non-ribosomal peptide synthetase, partial [Firmicutes bacterium HGW-Firmicutes-7]